MTKIRDIFIDPNNCKIQTDIAFYDEDGKPKLAEWFKDEIKKIIVGALKDEV